MDPDLGRYRYFYYRSLTRFLVDSIQTTTLVAKLISQCSTCVSLIQCSRLSFSKMLSKILFFDIYPGLSLGHDERKISNMQTQKE